MKHVQDYYSYITEGKKQYTYLLKVDSKKFNLFDLLNDLKPLGGEVLDGQPGKDSKDEIEVLIAMDDSKKKKIDAEIEKQAEIISVG